jgi:BASS family bile acid:Na+ symporter
VQQLPAFATAIVWAYLVSAMFSIGLELGAHPKESKEAKRKLRRNLVRGLALTAGLLPLVAIGLTHLLHLDGPVAVAVIILACSSAGRHAPQLAKVGGIADASYATELTLFGVKLTAFTAPVLSGWALGHVHVHIRDLVFLAQLVALQIVPLWIGKWMRRRRPGWAERIARPTTWVAGVAAVLVAAFVMVDAGRKLLDFVHDPAWLAAAVLAAASPILGWLVGTGDRTVQRTLAISTNTRGLALALAIASAAGTDPRVRPALFAVWFFFTAVSFVVAVGLRRPSGDTRSRAPGRAASVTPA